MIAAIFLLIFLAGNRLYAIKIPEPYVYTIYFESHSATPDIDYISKLGAISDAIRSKRPVKIDIEGAATVGEAAELAGRRAGYVERWLKSEKINASYTVKTVDRSDAHTIRYIDERANRRVRIVVYDQKYIYAMQDAERIVRAKAIKKPIAYVAAIVHSFGSVMEGDFVEYEFNIRNVGDANLEIIKVKPD